MFRALSLLLKKKNSNSLRIVKTKSKEAWKLWHANFQFMKAVKIKSREAWKFHNENESVWRKTNWEERDPTLVEFNVHWEREVEKKNLKAIVDRIAL